MIVDAIPTLFNLRNSLNAAANDESQLDDDDESSISFRETPAVIRIAAHASVLLINKYLGLLWECEIYFIAIGAVLSHLSYITIVSKMKFSHVS